MEELINQIDGLFNQYLKDETLFPTGRSRVVHKVVNYPEVIAGDVILGFFEWLRKRGDAAQP